MIAFVFENAEGIFHAVTAAIAAAAAFAALTPSPKDDGIVAKLRKAVDFVAGNFGHAKNGK